MKIFGEKIKKKKLSKELYFKLFPPKEKVQKILIGLIPFKFTLFLYKEKIP